MSEAQHQRGGDSHSRPRAHVLPTRHRHRRRAMETSRILATHSGGSRVRRGDPPSHSCGKRPQEKGKMMSHFPQGPDGAWKTGQRVPFDGNWTDQYGLVSFHERGATFPPCIDRKGECAYRYPVEAVAAA
jgi:hypothetical protein